MYENMQVLKLNPISAGPHCILLGTCDDIMTLFPVKSLREGNIASRFVDFSQQEVAGLEKPNDYKRQQTIKQ